MIYVFDEDKNKGYKKYSIVSFDDKIAFETFVEEHNLEIQYSNKLDSLVLVPKNKTKEQDNDRE